MKFYSLYVCDTRELMEAGAKVLEAMSFNYSEEVDNCPLNIELRSLIAEGKSEDEIYATICAHQEEGPYDLFWSAAIFSPLTKLSNEEHQAAVVDWMIKQYPDQVGLFDPITLHPKAKALFEEGIKKQ